MNKMQNSIGIRETIDLGVNRNTNHLFFFLPTKTPSGPTTSPFPFIPENLQSKNCAALPKLVQFDTTSFSKMFVNLSI